MAEKDNALMKNTEVMLGEQLIHLIQNIDRRVATA
jgi:hypothetical protein